MDSAPNIAIAHAGFQAIVTKNEHHPEGYLWIDVANKRYFLGVLERGMKRRDVKAMACAFLERLARRANSTSSTASRR